MRVVIFGSTGGTGRALVEQALDLSHEVVAFARIPAHILIHHERLTVLQGDVLDSAKVNAAVAGADAVLSALGVGAGFANNPEVLSIGTRNILASMNTHGVRRFICESSYGVAESYDRAAAAAKVVFRTLLKRVYAEKAMQEQLLRRSNADWVIVRPTVLTNGPKRGHYRVAEDLRLGMMDRISRADVAHFMLKQLTEDTWLRKCPALSY
ncbi:MAG TPA: SDR family oxidoreductase [Terriglobales bacterium]|nr:SDR family oxidoreductase [Terriglobales bacterium]